MAKQIVAWQALDGSLHDNETDADRQNKILQSPVTEEQINRYLTYAVNCPRCESDMIHGHSVETGEGRAEQLMHCSDCGFEWCDEYQITGIRQRPC